MTITWHVYYLKVSNKYLVYITRFACYPSSIYGKELKVKRLKVHFYLGMDLGSTGNGAVKV